MGSEWVGVPEAKHARQGRVAALDGWCDLGEHKIVEGEIVIENPESEGFVHVKCL